MQLTEQEKESALWKKLKAHCEGLIAKSHLALEKSISIEETYDHRGRIKLIRSLIKLEANQPGPDGTENNR